MRWGVILCSCNDTLRIDPQDLKEALRLEHPPVLFTCLPRNDLHACLSLVERQRFERLLIGCCGPAALFREAVGAAGMPPEHAVVVNLREPCFWVHGDGAAAHAKAARLLRSAMRTAEVASPAPELPVRVGSTVLLATDAPVGLQLARRLAEVAQPVVILDERSDAFDDAFLHPLPWRVNWGRVTQIDGSLGNFRVTVERTQPLDLERCIYCRRCLAVCPSQAISEGLRIRTERCDDCSACLQACAAVGAIRMPRHDRQVIAADQVVIVARDAAPPTFPRTGYHLLRAPTQGDLDAVAWRVAALIGEFLKPASVRYDPELCAGGAAGHASCGLCIDHCPYHAIRRNPHNPLRVLVDPHACEGCGACVSACPTAALRFTDPPPTELHTRLEALLAPLPGRPPSTPPILAFHCPEEGQRLLSEAGRRRLAYAAAVLPVPMACLRHVSEADMLAALRLGAGGVALLGCAACPHGERPLVQQKVAVTRTILEAFGLGAERLQLIAVEDDVAAAIAALDRFAAAVPPTPVRWDGQTTLPAEPRAVIAEAILAFIEATGREPGAVELPAAAPFSIPEVNAGDCTLSRACVNVCPSHAFRFDEAGQRLELKALACVNCGLCATVCPERAIALRPAIPLTRQAFDWQVVVQDTMIACVACGKPFINQKALAAVEAKVLSIASLVDVFAGARRSLLRLCPDCRAVAAMREMEKGWEP
jgi:heterodisulfide reductase subunit A-like polyferredoxin/coenzyme F420-reducing hydrogenase delta subunit